MKTGKKNTEWKEDMYMDNETDLFVHNWNNINLFKVQFHISEPIVTFNTVPLKCVY